MGRPAKSAEVKHVRPALMAMLGIVHGLLLVSVGAMTEVNQLAVNHIGGLISRIRPQTVVLPHFDKHSWYRWLDSVT